MSSIQLSDSEWELMKVLWDCEPVSVNDIAAKLHESTQWHRKTVRTMLNRLVKKGIVEQVIIDNIQHYQALLTREECSTNATQSFLDRVFDGSFTPFLVHFTKSNKLSDEERKALEKLLEDSSPNNKDTKE